MRLFSLTVLWVWRSKDLLACNATYSIATKGQNAGFFLHLIYGLDYYARARHIFHSSIIIPPSPLPTYCTIQRMYSNSIPTLLKLLALQKMSIFRHKVTRSFEYFALSRESLNSENVKKNNVKCMHYDAYYICGKMYASTSRTMSCYL